MFSTSVHANFRKKMQSRSTYYPMAWSFAEMSRNDQEMDILLVFPFVTSFANSSLLYLLVPMNGSHSLFVFTICIFTIHSFIHSLFVFGRYCIMIPWGDVRCCSCDLVWVHPFTSVPLSWMLVSSPPEHATPPVLRKTSIYLLTRALLGGGGVWTPPGFSRIAKIRRRAAPPGFHPPYPHIFRNFCENFDPRSCKVRSPGQVKWSNYKKNFPISPRLQCFRESYETYGMW